MSAVQTIAIADTEAGQRLDRWLKKRFPQLTHGRVEKLLRTGQIRVDGGRVKGSHRIETGQAVRIPPLPDKKYGDASPVPDYDKSRIRNMVIYEDDDFIGLNKPSGLAVQGGSKTYDHIDKLLPALGEGVRLIHRLDRDTSGVLLAAKSVRAAARAGKMFQGRKVEKIYYAVTNGVPHPLSGEIKGYVGKGKLDKRFGSDKAGREIMMPVHHGDDGGKYARTLYQTSQRAAKRAGFVVLKPLTGRTHQLRLHLQLLGAPVAGDPKYLTDRPLPGGLESKLHLHARSLTLPGKNGPIHIEAPMPDHMTGAFELMGFDANARLEPWDQIG